MKSFALIILASMILTHPFVAAAWQWPSSQTIKIAMQAQLNDTIAGAKQDPLTLGIIAGLVATPLNGALLAYGLNTPYLRTLPLAAAACVIASIGLTFTLSHLQPYHLKQSNSLPKVAPTNNTLFENLKSWGQAKLVSIQRNKPSTQSSTI